MVIDEAVTLTGSYNWTRGAARTRRTSTWYRPRLSRRPTRRTGASASPSPSGSSGARTGARSRRQKSGSALIEARRAILASVGVPLMEHQ